ncbi:hypothetical protein [Dictyobacter alpinus]|uniref:hypothetical protein n=1 Tax=Dictyobacter alpinus TaxID=2014873 RepID=UPI000F83FD64|nr:hypothetical protein [Dictyobacter alpinus]
MRWPCASASPLLELVCMTFYTTGVVILTPAWGAQAPPFMFYWFVQQWRECAIAAQTIFLLAASNHFLTCCTNHFLTCCIKPFSYLLHQTIFLLAASNHFLTCCIKPFSYLLHQTIFLLAASNHFLTCCIKSAHSALLMQQVRKK